MTSRNFAVRGLDHVVLRVSDEAQALEFYCGLLGLREERRLPEIGLIQLRAGQSLIDLVVVSKETAASEGPAGRNMEHFALQIEGFDAAHMRDYLGERGIAVGEPADRYGSEGTGPSLYIKDPDGNTVELKGPAYPGTRLTAKL